MESSIAKLPLTKESHRSRATLKLERLFPVQVIRNLVVYGEIVPGEQRVVLANWHIPSQKRQFSSSHIAAAIPLFPLSSQGLAFSRKAKVVQLTAASPFVLQVPSAFWPGAIRLNPLYLEVPMRRCSFVLVTQLSTCVSEPERKRDERPSYDRWDR